MNKKRVVSTLFLYLSIFSLGCDFESPQKWETPSWYLPLTLPLVNTVYSFEGMVDSSMLFPDSISNVIQVVFGDSLPANGIPDETFNIDMSTGGVDADDLDVGMEGISIEVAGVSFGLTPAPAIPNSGFNDLTRSGTCYPLSHVGLLQSIVESASSITSGSIDMPLSFESNELISIKKVIVDEGNWNMIVTNDWSVPLSVTFTLINGETEDSILYIFSTISPYTIDTNRVSITSSAPTILDVNSSFNYSIDISILNIDINNLNQSSNCTGYECSHRPIEFVGGFDSELDCNNEPFCGSCLVYEGWYNDPAVSEMLTIEFSASFDKIGSVVAEVNVDIPAADPLIIDIPSMQGIEIMRAKFAEYSEDYKNQFQFDITNGFYKNLNMTMSYKNIFDYVTNSEGEINLTDSLIIPMIIKPNSTLDTTISISDKFLAYGSNSDEPVKSIEIAYEIGIESGIDTIDVVNDSIKIGMPKINDIGVTNLRLKYIAAVSDSLSFPPLPSAPIEGMPDGFTGFEFYDVIIEIDFYNEIGMPVGLNMELLGSKADSTETIAVNINTEIGAPYKDNYGCTFNFTGDIARTVIKINKDFQTTEYYCSPDAPDPSLTITDTFSSDGSDNTRIVDLMNFAPENIYVGGDVIINGEGILAPDSQIWGTFTLIAPLAFIFEQPINIIPAEPTAMEPMDPSTAQQIDSALVEAALNVTITNNSPLGGSLSLLISDSTIFPLFLDSLTTGSWENQIYNFNTAIWDTLEPPMVIDSISFTAIDPTSDTLKALEVKFFNNDNLQFFIGRMFELGFPRADSIDYHLGYANPEFPNIHTSSMVIDTTRMAWVITDQSRYNNAMISLDSSPIQSITGTDTAYIPLTFQTTNTIGVQAYFTLTLDTGGLGRETNSNDK